MIRIVGLLLLGLSIGAPLYALTPSWWDWAFLFFVVLVWPHLAYFVSSRHSDQIAREYRNVRIESLFGGIAMGAIGFNLIPCVVIYLVLCINSFGINMRLFSQSILMVAAGAGFSAIVHDFQWQPISSTRDILFSLPLLLIYPIVSGFASRDAARRIARQAKTLSEEVDRRVEAERKAQQARIAAEAANQTKSEFLAGMSHELRTPLNAIIGFADALRAGVAGPLNDKQMSYAGHIATSGGLLLALINDLLDLSKLEAGKAQISEELISVEDVVADALAMVKVQCASEAIHVDTEIIHDLPHLRADERMTTQMLLNLLSNAIKFTVPDGTVSVTGGLSENGELQLSVEDTGRGMDVADIPRARARFEQLETDQKHKGTGLGLPLVEEMIELHGGHLELVSELNRGTRATLVFPAARVVYPVTEPAQAAIQSNNS